MTIRNKQISNTSTYTASIMSNQQLNLNEQKNTNTSIPIATVVSSPNKSSSNSPLHAHVIADTTCIQLQNILQTRLITIGLQNTNLKCEIRMNRKQNTTNTTFCLTLIGKVQIHIGSLFNMIIYKFVQEYPSITEIARQVTFIRNTNIPSTNNIEETIDSEQIIQIKMQHIYKLFSTSTSTVIYTGENLNTTNSKISSSSTIYPPQVLADWYSSNRVSYFITDSCDGTLIQR
jgi:hypothetical protein